MVLLQLSPVGVITSTQNITSGLLKLEAPQSLNFNATFEVGPGASLTALINNCAE